MQQEQRGRRTIVPFRPQADTCQSQSHGAVIRRPEFLFKWKYKEKLRLEAILRTPAAGAKRDVGGGQDTLLGLGLLSLFGERVDDSTDETNEDG